MSMNIDYTNKVVLITGGTAGIGYACAQLFLELGASYVGTTGNNANATELNILTLTVVSGRPGVAYTVTNLYGAYKLPATGGRGTETLTRGGLALAVTAAFSALMYLCDFGRKRKKGGI